MTDNREFDFSGHIKHIEVAQAVDLPTGENKTLTDSELEQAGLVKTSAFVRTKRSKNALRVEKNRDKKAADGVKQLNVEVPEQHRDLLKVMAKAMKDGLNPSEALKIATGDVDRAKPGQQPSASKKTPQSDSEHQRELNQELVIGYGKKVAEIKSQGGIKSLLLKMAGV
ncbi:MAG: hypothetical protein NWQ54_14100 [Paraglaciecola sp.]|nr:hypothetical protein [Paraglaciecola sp.]